MNQLIVIVGPSGVGKTTLAKAVAERMGFELGLEQHGERPFQELFKQDKDYALANQLDYLLFRAEQERALRAGSTAAVMDGGLDLDFHGFTRLFHARGWLSDAEFELCRRVYALTRDLLPLPDLIIALSAAAQTIAERLASRARINVTSSEDAELLTKLVDEWLESLPSERVLKLDTSIEDMDYAESIRAISRKLKTR